MSLVYNKLILNRVIDGFGVNKQVIGDNHTAYGIMFALPSTSKLNNISVKIVATDGCVVFEAISPIKANPSVRNDVIEYITRVNYSEFYAKLLFDCRDGEIKAQTVYHCVGDALPDEESMRQSFLYCIVLLNNYGDGLVNTLMGIGTPESNYLATQGE